MTDPPARDAGFEALSERARRIVAELCVRDPDCPVDIPAAETFVLASLSVLAEDVRAASRRARDAGFEAWWEKHYDQDFCNYDEECGDRVAWAASRRAALEEAEHAAWNPTGMFSTDTIRDRIRALSAAPQAVTATCEGTLAKGYPCTRAASRTIDGRRYCRNHGYGDSAAAPQAEPESAEPPHWGSFGREVLERMWEWGDVDHASLQEMALEAGVIRAVPGGFDPKNHHDNAGCCEPGDTFYEVVEEHARPQAEPEPHITATETRIALDNQRLRLGLREPEPPRAASMSEYRRLKFQGVPARPPACSKCGGSGRVPVKNGSRWCPACSGPCAPGATDD